MTHNAITQDQLSILGANTGFSLRRQTEPPAVGFRLHKLGGCVVEVHLPKTPSLCSLRRLAQGPNRLLFQQFLDSLDDPPENTNSVREVTQ